MTLNERITPSDISYMAVFHLNDEIAILIDPASHEGIAVSI